MLFFLLILSIALIPVLVIWFFRTLDTKTLQKEYMMNLYSSLLSDMNVDYRDQKMTPQNIVNIAQSLQNLTDDIETSSRHIQKQSAENQRWLVDLIQELDQNLKLWIDRHTDEIDLYIQDIEKNTPRTSEKWVFGLVIARLENQKQILRKI